MNTNRKNVSYRFSTFEENLNLSRNLSSEHIKMLLSAFRKVDMRIKLLTLAFRGSLVFALAILVCSASPAWAARNGVKWENLAEHLAGKSIPTQLANGRARNKERI
jgi:hypothetical protein